MCSLKKRSLLPQLSVQIALIEGRYWLFSLANS